MYRDGDIPETDADMYRAIDRRTTAKFDPEVWARTQPHAFFSHWPTASMTKCDFCGVRFGEHPVAPDEADDVATHPTKAIPGGHPTWGRA